MKETISIRLLNMLEKGKAHLSDEALQLVSGFVKHQMADDCTFLNKGGKTDLYYTAFGWMLCYVLGIKLDPKKMRSYLAALKSDGLDLIHYAAYVRCIMLTGVLRNGRLISASGKILNSQVFSKKASDTRLSKVLNPGRFQIVNDWLKNGSNAAVGVERLIIEPGSFKIKELKDISEFKGVPHNDPRSPYSQFIWLSLLEDTGNKTAGKAQILSALEEYHQPGGGYRNIQEAPGASTNATVAALSVRGQLAGYNKNQDTDYLKSLQQPTGGFCAATASPVPDLLSTATALFMLKCYDEVPRYDPGDFLEAHWLNSGGFCPTLIDDTSDVEYTFYGLLALGTIE